MILRIPQHSMEVNMHYLYRITNLLNQKVYIGQSNQEKERWRQHKYYSRYPEKTRQYVHRAMAKYGINNFIYEVIACCKTQDEANLTEDILIDQYDSKNVNKGYNIASGGNSKTGYKIRSRTELEKQTISLQMKAIWENRSISDKENIIKNMRAVAPNISLENIKKFSDLNRKLTDIQRLEILSDTETSYNDLAKKYDVSRATISNIKLKSGIRKRKKRIYK